MGDPNETQRLQRLVNDFAEEMKSKLLHKKADGWQDWDLPQYRERFYAEVIQHALKGDWVDVANFAAFLWNIDERQ